MRNKENCGKILLVKNYEQIIKGKSFEKFNKIVLANRLSHAYLVLSPDEEFNKQFSKAMALKIVCEADNICFKCENCLKMLNDFHPDVLVYPKGQHLMVSDSESIIENADIKPMVSEKKVFILNNMDKATPQAQNKLLKTLEEAPKNVVFILNATDANNILQTIKSRTWHFVLEPLDQETVKAYFSAKNIFVSEMALKMGEGWIGKTQAYFDGAEKESFEKVLTMLKEMKSTKTILNFASDFAKKDKFITNLTVLQELMEEILYIKLNLKQNPLLEDIAPEFRLEAVYDIFELIILAKKQFKANVNPSLITDNLLFKILEVKYLWNSRK